MVQNFNLSTRNLLTLDFISELLTSGVENVAGMLEDVHDFAIGVSEVLQLLHQTNLFSGFPVRRPRLLTSSNRVT